MEITMKCLYGEKINKADVVRKKKNGKKIGHAVLCDDILYHSYFFITAYVRYEDIKRAYMRVENSESGDFGVTEYSLIVVTEDDREHRLHLDYAEYVKEVLEYLRGKHHHIIIGKH